MLQLLFLLEILLIIAGLPIFLAPGGQRILWVVAEWVQLMMEQA